MATVTRRTFPRGGLLDARLRYHLRCLREDATDPEISPVERLALVRDRAERIREIRRELEAAMVMKGMKGEAVCSCTRTANPPLACKHGFTTPSTR